MIKSWWNMISGQMIPVLASYGTDGIINSTTAFVISRWSKWDATWLTGHLMAVLLALVSHDVNSITNGTITFLRLRQLKWDATWCFCHMMPLASCDASGIGVDVMWCNCISVSIMWYEQHHQWYLCIPYVKMTKWGAKWYFWSCDTIDTSTGIMPIVL